MSLINHPDHPDEDKCEACGGFEWEVVGFKEKICKGCGNLRVKDNSPDGMFHD